MVVDDEQAIRDMIEAGLKDHGYRTVAAADGAQAIPTLRQHQTTLDLILLDADMPIMDGRATLIEIRALKADLPVIIMSGSEEEKSSFDSSHPATLFLQKPFLMADLLVAVKKSISKNRGGHTDSSNGSI